MDKKLDTVLLFGSVGLTALYLFYLKPKFRQIKEDRERARMQQSWQDVLDGKKTITEHNPDFTTVYSWNNGMPCYVPPCAYTTASSKKQN